jgi:hypothetical protein
MFVITLWKWKACKQLDTESIPEPCPGLPYLEYIAAKCIWKHFRLCWQIVLFSSDVMVLNEIIEQAAGHQSRASEQGGKYS